jgi:hypothetical protein
MTKAKKNKKTKTKIMVTTKTRTAKMIQQGARTAKNEPKHGRRIGVFSRCGEGSQSVWWWSYSSFSQASARTQMKQIGCIAFMSSVACVCLCLPLCGDVSLLTLQNIFIRSAK